MNPFTSLHFLLEYSTSKPTLVLSSICVSTSTYIDPSQTLPPYKCTVYHTYLCHPSQTAQLLPQMISYLTLLAITPLLIPGLALSLPTPQDALKAANSIIHPLSLPSPAVPDASVAITRPIPETESSVVNDEGDYIHITSTRHPDHSVSIKETTGWCDPDVRSFSG